MVSSTGAVTAADPEAVGLLMLGDLADVKFSADVEVKVAEAGCGFDLQSSTEC